MVRVGTLHESGAKAALHVDLAEAKLVGFDTIRMTSVWMPGESAASPGELTGLLIMRAFHTKNGRPRSKVELSYRFSAG